MATGGQTRRERLLHEHYTDVSNPASFSSIKKLWQRAKEDDPGITLKQVREYLSSQESYTLHGNIPRRYPRTPVYVAKQHLLLAADLGDLQKLKDYNDGYSYIFLILDCFSRKLDICPVKRKDGKSVADAFQHILNKGEIWGRFLWIDRGSEMFNPHFTKVAKTASIKMYATKNYDTKSVYAERHIRTIKSRLYKAMTHFNTRRWIDMLPKIVTSYNLSAHRGLLGLTPNHVHSMKNPTKIRHLANRMYEHKYRNYSPQYIRGVHSRTNVSDRLKVGDYVRLLTAAAGSVFAKGYQHIFTVEVFRVKTVIHDTPPYYILEDLAGEEVEGKVYGPELKLTTKPEIYKIAAIVDRRITSRGKNQIKVAWEGYGDKFNSWINESELKNV